LEAEMHDSSSALQTLIDAEKLQYCYECGICTASCPMVELLPEHYHPRTLLQRIFLDLDGVLREEALWLCAWCYRCYRRCPQKLLLPEIFLRARKLAMKKGYLGGLEEAAELIRKEIPLPQVCQQVCFHPERADIDILQTIRTNYEFRKEMETAPQRKNGEKIAIVGSGPAGLTAACELAMMGYQVTVFESSSELGGMLRECMPTYRLSRKVLEADIEHMKKLGIEIKTGVTIGRDLTLQELSQDGYKAVFLATGAHKSRKLRIEGTELKGVIYALDFLRKSNLGEEIDLGERVAVIGGGNVAMDAARTALKLGAKDISILYRRSREEMPANPWEVKEAESEGVKISFLASPTKILGEDGHVTAIECVRMELGEPDETGRRRPTPIEDSEFTTEFDTVILAIGESPDLSFLPKEIWVSEQNTILVDPVTMTSNLPGVFAGGDVVSGPATVIEAIAAGKRVALSIHRYLKGEDTKGGEIEVSVRHEGR
jgi:NADPH-dependent glutamate synthase beta subunit-like oxidoreductase